MATVRVRDTEDMADKFLELVHATKNMRFAQSQWSIHFGSYWKIKKQQWEQRVDNILREIGISEDEFKDILSSNQYTMIIDVK